MLYRVDGRGTKRVIYAYSRKLTLSIWFESKYLETCNTKKNVHYWSHLKSLIESLRLCFTSKFHYAKLNNSWRSFVSKCLEVLIPYWWKNRVLSAIVRIENPKFRDMFQVHWRVSLIQLQIVGHPSRLVTKVEHFVFFFSSYPANGIWLGQFRYSDTPDVWYPVAKEAKGRHGT